MQHVTSPDASLNPASALQAPRQVLRLGGERAPLLPLSRAAKPSSREAQNNASSPPAESARTLFH